MLFVLTNLQNCISIIRRFIGSNFDIFSNLSTGNFNLPLINSQDSVHIFPFINVQVFTSNILFRNTKAFKVWSRQYRWDKSYHLCWDKLGHSFTAICIEGRILPRNNLYHLVSRRYGMYKKRRKIIKVGIYIVIKTVSYSYSAYVWTLRRSYHKQY